MSVLIQVLRMCCMVYHVKECNADVLTSLSTMWEVQFLTGVAILANVSQISIKKKKKAS